MTEVEHSYALPPIILYFFALRDFFLLWRQPVPKITAYIHDASLF